MKRLLVVAVGLALATACKKTDTDHTGDSDTTTTAATLPDFACGDALTCTGGVQYCFHGEGGAVTDSGNVASNYECRTLPDACTTAPSCACLSSNGVDTNVGDCSEDGTGGVTVTAFYP